MARRDRQQTGDAGSVANGTAEPNHGNIGADNGLAGEAVDTATASGGSTTPVGDRGNDDASDGNPGRKRRNDIGRKRGPRKGGASPVLEIDGVSAVLVSAHAMLAGLTSTTELRLEKAEADHLAKGIAGVAAFYDTVISPKTMAWINLSQVAAMVYGPRLFAINARRTQERAARRAGRPVSPANGAANPNAEASGLTNEPGVFMPSELNNVHDIQ